MDVTDYPALSNSALLIELARTTRDLIGAYNELATSEMAETQERVTGYFGSASSTQQGKDWDAKRAGLSATLSTIELKYQISALTDEKFLIIRLLEWRAKEARDEVI